ncbi:hypothetical protein JAAARDRAFT_73330 [Jaapia argillacea MUCL 33604]|uniref:Uncharacterized protein n=1 Tax=Jaapia argillacea MUCL 33604 TaxID=933084 RepID=A0A067PLD0_9AGAM|nr:hypothetical protein JAAARDRAFT_73330 [Jaapia argillacea MUCL 33604]
MRWTYVPYFAGRYAVIASFVTLISTGLPSSDDCSATIRFVLAQVSFAFAVGGASLNLTIPTVVIWQCNRYVTALLVWVSVLHWTTLFFSAGHLAQISKGGNGFCNVHVWGDGSLTTVYATTIILDLLDFVLSIVGLARFATPTTQVGSRNRLWRAVVKQGVGYFLLTLLLNVPSLVFASLNLNRTMEVMSNLPAMICSVMASCRAVSSLIRDPDTDGMCDDGPPVARTAFCSGSLFATHMDLPDTGRVQTVQPSQNENISFKRSPC